MRRAGFAGAVHLVETSPALREAQAALLPGAVFHDRIEDLPPRPLLLVANEFFDALPVAQWVGDEQRRVTHDGDALRLHPRRRDPRRLHPRATPPPPRSPRISRATAGPR